MRARIDLNADVGEGLGPWRAGDDRTVLGAVTSASVACGFHAGDPTIMRDTCRVAAEHGVAIGAHVGYPDLAGFGRRAMDLSEGEIADAVVVQIGALAACATSVGSRVRYVKAHGALYHRAAGDSGAAEAIVGAVADVGGDLMLLGPPASALSAACARAGTRFAAEGFADRAYRGDGSLVPRSHPHGVLSGAAALEQAISLAVRRRATSADGQSLELPVQSLCVHGDSLDAGNTARRIRLRLHDAGVEVAPFA